MTPEIEALQRIVAGRINKSHLPEIQEALAKACELCDSLESKSVDEDSTEEFEDLKSTLENDLSELESACDDLEAAEEKEERDDAIDRIESALDSVILSFEAVIPVAIVSTVDQRATKNELKAKIKELMQLTPEESAAAFLSPIQSSATEELRKRRIEAFNECSKAIRREESDPRS